MGHIHEPTIAQHQILSDRKPNVTQDGVAKERARFIPINYIEPGMMLDVLYAFKITAYSEEPEQVGIIILILGILRRCAQST